LDKGHTPHMRRIEIWFLVLAVVLTIFLHAHYMSGLYYEQDVAFYANSTLELSRGKSLYSGFRNWGNKPPGINYIFLLAFSLFGPSFISIQIFSLIAKILTVVLFFLLAKILLAKGIKVYYLLPLFYAVFSSSESIQAHTSNLETFLIPFEMAGILFLGIAARKKKNAYYFLSGAMLGLSFLIKQSGLIVYLGGFIFIIILKILNRESGRVFLRQSVLFLSAFLIPLLFLFRHLSSLGVGAWERFIKNVFVSNIAYIKNISIIRNIYMSWSVRQVWNGLWPEIIIFGLLALIGLIGSLIRFKKTQRLLALSWFLAMVVIFSRVGLHLRHHFIEILPPFLMLSVIGVSDIWQGVGSLFKEKKSLLRLFAVSGTLILIIPYLHVITTLVKKRSLENSFFITQRYLKSADKGKYARRLLGESHDAGRRFLISQYVLERTAKEDKIFVWDGLGAGSVYLWTQRGPVTSTSKFTYLPLETIGPIGAFLYRDPSLHPYKDFQQRLLKGLSRVRPIYIVVIESALPMPFAPFSSSRMLSLEKKAFKEFFDLLETDYHLEKEIRGCFVYRLASEDAQ
jgi:4-amino-4-deoxy-L-arabinose transferase-like glycosyltransferase